MPNKCDGVAKLKKLEQRLDRRFSLFGVQFGTDAIVGLIPIVCDILTSATGLYIIHQSSKLGATRWTITRMLINWGIDTGVGLIPIFGDIFDVAFKSNTKNVKGRRRSRGQLRLWSRHRQASARRFSITQRFSSSRRS